MPVGDLLEVRYVSTLGVQAGINVRHYRISSITGTELPLILIATSLSGRVRDLYKALMTTSAEFRFVGVKRILPIPVTAEVIFNGDRGTGARSGDPLPIQTSGLISLRSGLAGRRNRGRMYPPFPAEVDNDANATPGTTYRTNLSSLAQEFFGTVTLAVGADVTTLRNVIHGRGTTTSVDITQAIPINRWATQRRRGDLGRPNIIVSA